MASVLDLLTQLIEKTKSLEAENRLLKEELKKLDGKEKPGAKGSKKTSKKESTPSLF